MKPIEYKGYNIREASDWSKFYGAKYEFDQPGEPIRTALSIEEAKAEIDELVGPEKSELEELREFKANFEKIQLALEEREELKQLRRWKQEMLQLWNKLDAYLNTRKDLRVGDSKVDFAIRIMKEHEKLKGV